MPASCTGYHQALSSCRPGPHGSSFTVSPWLGKDNPTRLQTGGFGISEEYYFTYDGRGFLRETP